MKVSTQDGRRIFLRFDKGEELLSGLLEFAKENNIQGAYFSVIGTAHTIEMGFFNDHLKEYRHKNFLDNYEILSLTGNIAQNKGEPFVHAHGCFSNNDFSVVGGHCFKVEVLATAEVFIVVLDKPLTREHNADINLDLLA